MNNLNPFVGLDAESLAALHHELLDVLDTVPMPDVELKALIGCVEFAVSVAMKDGESGSVLTTVQL